MMKPTHHTPSAGEEQEYDVAAAHPNAPMPETADEGVVEAAPATAPTVPLGSSKAESGSDYVIEEYESFKRKNRRRLIGAGALVLIAGGLFAAASQQSGTPAAPALAPETRQAPPHAVTAEILYPDNKASAAAQAVNHIDDSQNAPIRMTKKIQAAAPLSPEEKAALEARQQRAKAQRLAQQRKQEAERAEQAAKEQTAAGNKPADKTAADTAPKKDPKRAAADKAKEREEEQRRKKAQALTAKAEAERNAKESATAAKAREAQLAADKQRAAERAKLEKQNKNKTADKTDNNKRTAADTRTDKNTSKTAADTGNRRVTIQAGAFMDKNHAQRVQQQLKSINYNSRLEEVQTAKGTVYRVRTGTFANQNEAKNALERIKNQGMNGVIVGK